MRLTLTLAALAFSGLTAVANAQSLDVSTRQVSYADLNLSNRAGAEAMLNRIEAAAQQVCGGKPHNGEMQDMTRYRACVSAAEKKAVADLNAPMVTQLYAQRTGTSDDTTFSQR